MKKDNLNKFLFVIGMVLIFVFIPIFINFVISQPSPIGFINNGNRDAWIGFFGAIIGGVFTLLGVRLTIDNDNKNRKIDLDLQRDYFEKNLRYEHLPALEFNMVDNEPESCNIVYISIFKSALSELKQSKPMYISVRNLGANNSKNLKLQCVVDGYSDCGMQDLHNGFIKVEDCLNFKIIVTVDQDFLNYFKGENSVSLSLFFTYEDIIGKVYRTRKQVYLYLNNSEKQDILSMSLFMFSDVENIPEFIEPSSRMFYLSQKEIQKFDKQLNKKKEDNISFVKYQSFNNKDTVDRYINIFMKLIIEQNLHMIDDIIFDKYKGEFNSGYVSCPYYIDIKNEGNLVIQKIKTNFYVHGLMINKYTFDICVNLKDEKVTFDNFKIKLNKIDNIIDFIRIKKLSRNISVSFSELSKLSEEKEKKLKK